MLTQERLKELFHYCPDTGIFTRIKPNTSRHKKGEIAGYKGKCGYIFIRIDKHLYRAHRLAWLYITGYFPHNEIDHINSIRCDNKFNNLRDVSKSGNMQNIKIATSRSKSGYLGVHFDKRAKKYIACIRINGKNIYIAQFICPIKAHNAYLETKRKHHDTCTI